MEKINACLAAIREKTDFVPRVAVVLGSGLGDAAEKLTKAVCIPYKELPGFPASTVSGHRGQFVCGYIGDVPTVFMQGRVHYYEGYPMEDVVLGVRIMCALGAKTLLLSNAAGGINPAFPAGTLMMIADHIASFVPSPLRGRNKETLGPRFPDMSAVYTPRVQKVLAACAADLSIPLASGVYLQVGGPQYETPAEIRAFRALGADAVGMSTAVEAIAARHMGMEVGGISCIVNAAAGMTENPLSHEEVKTEAAKMSEKFSLLLTEAIKRLGGDEV